ncbi:hypothetical protein SCHPADRAFT_262415 [Schizopora paradoxa]|uniref:Uncharacterized protein n=1 Tax=Schizopora paradoxa TaxID=27342 RepID=A0A0H2RUC9_9AGAM|nr:hypothetical protein SCHPADRAFT_262415 [Schizopora paradoxa]
MDPKQDTPVVASRKYSTIYFLTRRTTHKTRSENIVQISSYEPRCAAHLLESPSLLQPYDGTFALRSSKSGPSYNAKLYS